MMLLFFVGERQLHHVKLKVAQSAMEMAHVRHAVLDYLSTKQVYVHAQLSTVQHAVKKVCAIIVLKVITRTRQVHVHVQLIFVQLVMYKVYVMVVFMATTRIISVEYAKDVKQLFAQNVMEMV